MATKNIIYKNPEKFQGLFDFKEIKRQIDKVCSDSIVPFKFIDLFGSKLVFVDDTAPKEVCKAVMRFAIHATSSKFPMTKDWLIDQDVVNTPVIVFPLGLGFEDSAFKNAIVAHELGHCLLNHLQLSEEEIEASYVVENGADIEKAADAFSAFTYGKEAIVNFLLDMRKQLVGSLASEHKPLWLKQLDGRIEAVRALQV